MSKLISAKKISLKNHPEIREDAIQKFIFDNPNVLGLGELEPIRREKIQVSGGRLDILLADDNGTRYEVEIQLGATDPSHIIRTIEYWDNERKRYPQYDHCAVIVAEEITGRFMNVIQLFNGAIPLIAMQIQAVKVGDDIQLSFVKVLDRVSYAVDEEDEVEPTDRNYWNKKSDVIKYVDEIFEDVIEYAPGFELNYNKYYIGVRKNGISQNFISFKPKKKFIYLNVKCGDDSNYIEELNEAGVEYTYDSRGRGLRLKISKMEEYKVNKAVFEKVIKEAMERKNIE
ncbi:hypothetical protein SAMN02745111_01090 [Eubacterium uniforme]|uniref:DUF5655 domain-containing protein n=1 Tax=Eubacterium uniforme TaxID=39495 RepID=A0A1T4VKF5_9FIRM|nr:hypothetical protein [Eubacterium uniforme]SKA65403.1 hypothetical protein SAMN02745111_01090 [Eubacterium uniforme]